MVKAIRLLKKERAQGCDQAMMVDESDTEDETDEDDDDDVPLSNLISVNLPVVRAGGCPMPTATMHGTLPPVGHHTQTPNL